MKILAIIISLISLIISGITLFTNIYQNRVKMSIAMIDKFNNSVIKRISDAISDKTIGDTVNDSYIAMKSMIKLYIYTDSHVANVYFIDKYVYSDVCQVDEWMKTLINVIEEYNYAKYPNMQETIKRYKKVVKRYKIRHEMYRQLFLNEKRSS